MSERLNKGKSIIAFPEEYVCIDTETTGLDFEYDEVIEISALRIRNGVIVDKFTSLVKPNQSHFFFTLNFLESLGYDSFDSMSDDVYHDILNRYLIPEYITDLTGITNDMICDAPSAQDVLPMFANFVSDSILMGHNVNFDINFLYDACEQCGIDLNNDFIDTMRIARTLFTELKHHRSEVDAVTTFSCYESMRRTIESELGFDAFIRSFEHNKSEYRERLLSVKPTVDYFDETNPLFDKAVVFTGALSNMSRKDAFQLVANMGGYPQETITKETNFLVVGSKEFAESVKNGRTNKMKKADKYREKGQDIIVLSENTFFQMI